MANDDDPADDENPRPYTANNNYIINDNKRAQMIGTVLVPDQSIMVAFALQIDKIITEASHGLQLGEQLSVAVPS
ncbi:hypothetical protein BS78_09G031800 [Paspalum vaginatum]|nr:hypothetical protein BS78_09G031800 [Paspalum vaginatum]